MTRDEILHFLQRHKAELKTNFGVVSIGLFGSYARNEAREESDIDILVDIVSPNKFRSFFNLNHFLESSFKKKVDLGLESSLKEFIRRRIQKDVIYA
ncbi:MAG: nucleotidyltransferase family protein [Chlamydiae bacterium]|nr:nucleotidyltransferase family protein [Chlamydiota bacterium]MBI3276469.1 nucleotidyltransferase family protein [Chlamydiota bacterium]